jgi:hypothetical protein
MIAIGGSTAIGATALAALYRYMDHPYLLILTLFGVAVLALLAVFSRGLIYVWLLIPQQIVLMMSAAGAITAVYLSHFADGVERARIFIAADQIPVVLAALGHTAAIIALVVARTR